METPTSGDPSPPPSRMGKSKKKSMFTVSEVTLEAPETPPTSKVLIFPADRALTEGKDRVEPCASGSRDRMAGVPPEAADPTGIGVNSKTKGEHGSFCQLAFFFGLMAPARHGKCA